MLKKRLDILQDKIKSTDVDAIIITNKYNRYYISGFKGTAGNLVITKDNAYLVTDFRYTEQAKKQAVHFEVVQWETSIFKTLNEIFKKHNISNLGFEDKDITYSHYLNFKNELEVRKLVPLGNLILDMRKVKDNTEIENMRKAASIADKAFSHILNVIKPGISELDIAFELEYFMKKNGARDLSFETIVASGVRSSLPHGAPTEKKIEVGDFVTMDFGCIYDNYCSDMTRTVAVGKVNDKQKEIYNIVLEAQEKALEQVKVGMKGKECDKISRDIISSYGYGNNFGHGLGHSVGLEIHESPSFSTREEEIIRPQMVITVEPGVYVEGLCGVRIEDMIVITSDGIDNLTSSEKKLLII